jgi:hypothetical protein
MRFRVSFSAREGEKKIKTKGDFALRKRPKVSTNAGFREKMCEFISI